MRLHVWALPLAVAAIAFLGTHSHYTPAAAIGYADSHWQWALANGCPGPVLNAGQQLVRRRAPGSGWFQPGFECAEFVGRALRAGGVPLPVVPQSNPAWPNLVNVDRLAYWLLTRGWAVPTIPTRLRPGDVVLFRYARPGQSASPNVWQHMALVVARSPLLLDAHNKSRYHVPLSSLAATAYQVQALHILPRRLARPMSLGAPLPSGSQVQVAWRDLWTTARVHLYWGQSYRVHWATRWSAALKGVPGSVPPAAVVEVPATPAVHLRGQTWVVLGVAPSGSAWFSTPQSPIPGWTGRGHLSRTVSSPPGWAVVKPQAVQIVRALPIEPLPERAPLPAAWAPRDSITVMDAEVWGRWVQVLWPGSPTGMGFVPLSQVRPMDLHVQRARRPIAIILGSGQRASIGPGQLWIRNRCQTYYSGVPVRLASCPKRRT